MTNQHSLSKLGWKHFFQQQLTLEEWEAFTIARVVGLERSVVHLLTPDGKQVLPIIPSMPDIAVGDWLLLDEQNKFQRLLERSSLFSRKAAGTKVATQLIAANVDTVLIVSSMNQDFNLNRIERYLALANEAGVKPVIVLSKLDCCDDPEAYQSKVQALDHLLELVMVNSLDKESVDQLKVWCSTGESVALLGSSGAGKSTIVNTLLGSEVQSTQSIREDDAKGRHTTTGRSIHFLAAGGLLLDTPGMRELQIANCEHGVDETFPEIVALATRCKFSDCHHGNEPGCAVRAAIETGKLEERRLASYQKLMKEQAFNASTLAEKRARPRVWSIRSFFYGQQTEQKWPIEIVPATELS